MRNDDERLIVESVSAVNETGVTVTFTALEEALEGAKVKVTSPTGTVHAVDAEDLVVGATSATFTFSIALDAVALGDWDVDGVTYEKTDLTDEEIAEALTAAESALAALPSVDEIAITDEAKVANAKALVAEVKELDADAVVEGEDKIEVLETKIQELKDNQVSEKKLAAAVLAAEKSITELPTVDNVKVSDKDLVSDAKALVEAVKGLDLNAVVKNEELIIKLENKIEELEEVSEKDKYFSFDKTTGTITSYSDEGPKNVVIPNEIEGINVINISDWAFRGKELTGVTIPNSITSIGNMAFNYNRITEVTIPSSVTNIGEEAFSSNRLRKIVIPNGITRINDGTFSGNRNLREVTIPNSVTSIGKTAFFLTDLIEITIPDSVTSIGEDAFAINKLKDIVIPNSITNIGEGAFRNNRLEKLIIPNSITVIEYKAFANNILTEVILPSSINNIAESAFVGNSLTSVTIPNSVTTIGMDAFAYNGSGGDSKDITEKPYSGTWELIGELKEWTRKVN